MTVFDYLLMILSPVPVRAWHSEETQGIHSCSNFKNFSTTRSEIQHGDSFLIKTLASELGEDMAKLIDMLAMSQFLIQW